MLAATAGATYASIFFNRAKDAGEDPELIVRQSRALPDTMDTPTKIIVGRIRKPEDVAQAVIAGAHIIGYDEGKITFGSYPPGYPMRPTPGEQPYIVLDHNKITKELGWRATIDLERGLLKSHPLLR